MNRKNDKHSALSFRPQGEICRRPIRFQQALKAFGGFLTRGGFEMTSERHYGFGKLFCYRFIVEAILHVNGTPNKRMIEYINTLPCHFDTSASSVQAAEKSAEGFSRICRRPLLSQLSEGQFESLNIIFFFSTPNK
jgi:hypothetical protein